MRRIVVAGLLSFLLGLLLADRGLRADQSTGPQDVSPKVRRVVDALREMRSGLDGLAATGGITERERESFKAMVWPSPDGGLARGGRLCLGTSGCDQCQVCVRLLSDKEISRFKYGMCVQLPDCS